MAADPAVCTEKSGDERQSASGDKTNKAERNSDSNNTNRLEHSSTSSRTKTTDKCGDGSSTNQKWAAVNALSRPSKRTHDEIQQDHRRQQTGQQNNYGSSQEFYDGNCGTGQRSHRNGGSSYSADNRRHNRSDVNCDSGDSSDNKDAYRESNRYYRGDLPSKESTSRNTYTGANKRSNTGSVEVAARQPTSALPLRSCLRPGTGSGRDLRDAPTSNNAPNSGSSGGGRYDETGSGASSRRDSYSNSGDTGRSYNASGYPESNSRFSSRYDDVAESGVSGDGRRMNSRNGDINSSRGTSNGRYGGSGGGSSSSGFTGDSRSSGGLSSSYSSKQVNSSSSGGVSTASTSGGNSSVLKVQQENQQRQALSIEEMLQKKQEKQAPPRLLFVSKKDRAAELQRREEQRKVEAKQKEAEMMARRRAFVRQEEIERDRERRERAKAREAERMKEEHERRQRLQQEQEQRERQRQYEGLSKDKSTLADLKLLNLPEQELRAKQQEKELEQIRMHYLGMRMEKKKIQKPSEKFRNIFNFEWDVGEDTARGDNNPLYQRRLEPQLLFGRGFRAGMDIREQRKTNNFYDELVKRRKEFEQQQREEGKQAAAEAAQAAEAAKAKLQHLHKDRDIDEEEMDKTHWTMKTREEMTERDWRIFREDFEIYIKGGRCPPPIRTWAESTLPWELIEAVKAAKYERPTPIQMQALPIAMEMRDLIGIAETGSGKTAAFVLPMLTYVKQLPPLNEETVQDGPYALILAPSRELALQIEEETQKFASFCRCRSVAVVGGRSAETQAFQLRQGCEIVIGTPGRVRDCLDRAFTVLNQCNYVVLDEADRMIDLGFEDVVNAILDQIPTSNLKSEDEAQALQQEMQAKAGHRLYRLTHMFSATMPPAVERLARKYLRAPSYISIGDPGAGKRAIEQRVEFVTEARKKQRLQEVLEESEPPVMVFVNQKKSADVLSKALSKVGFSACALHGGKAQDSRELALNSFKEGSYDVLVATDVAGRGIDVQGVKLVVNFDMPKDIEAYTHRIGRTGRAGNKGLAISFVTEADSNLFFDLKKFLTSTNNIVPLELAQHPASKVKGGNKDNIVKPLFFN